MTPFHREWWLGWRPALADRSQVQENGPSSIGNSSHPQYLKASLYPHRDGPVRPQSSASNMQTVDKAQTTWGGPRLARKVQNVSPQCTWIPGGGPGEASQRGGGRRVLAPKIRAGGGAAPARGRR